MDSGSGTGSRSGPGSAHGFNEIFIHLNWHCFKDRPLIKPEIEGWLHSHFKDYCARVRGVHYQGSGGTEDHVHLLIQMEPFVLLSEFVGKLKGSSSHDANRKFGPDSLTWQRGYGAVSFSRKHLSSVLDYVARQKEHHQRVYKLNPTLERYAGGDESYNALDGSDDSGGGVS